MNTTDDFFTSLNRSKHKTKIRYAWDAFVRLEPNINNQDFRCIHCQAHVSADPLLSGVHNRNHCPYCLHSRHMDLHQPGDRLSACKTVMQPVGLTLKQTRKKYGLAQFGELMLIHHCTACSRLSANRLAADDDTDRIYQVYLHSCTIDLPDSTQGNIRFLTEADSWLVEAQLFGKNASLPEGWGREALAR